MKTWSIAVQTLIAHKVLALSDDLASAERRVGAALLDHYNRRTGQCDPSLATLAKLLGLSRRTVIRANGALTRKRYFTKVRHGGKFHRNQYAPNWPHFAAKEQAWKEARRAARHSRDVENLSLLQGQSCHTAG